MATLACRLPRHLDMQRGGADLCLLASTALAAGALLPLAPAPVVGLALAVVGLSFGSSRSRAVSRLARGFGGLVPWAPLAIVLVMLAVGAFRARVAVSQHERKRAQSDAVIPQPARCAGRVRVTSSPVVVHSVLRWDGLASDLNCEGADSHDAPRRWGGAVTLYGGPRDLSRGDEVDVVATLAAPQRLWNFAVGDPRPSEARRAVLRTGGALDVSVVRLATGILATLDRARAHVRYRIDATFPSDLAPMARALVLGENDLAEDDDRSFRASGLSHLLAVSGMHLVLVLALVVRTLEATLVRIESLAARIDVGRVAAAIGVLVAWAYADFAGAGGSTLRAAWMATAGLLARSLGRRSDAVRAFGLSIGAMAVVDPLVAFDLSFALSAVATAGLLSFARPLGETLVRRVPHKLSGVARAVATTLAASLPCAPIIACFSPTVPLAGVLANVFAVPVGECAALPLCLVHALLGSLPDAERGCAVVASGALVVVRAIARWAAMPAATATVPPPTSFQLALVALALASFAIPLRRGLRAWAIAAVIGGLWVLEVRERAAGAPRGVLRATFLDVGQGDAAVVDLPDGEALVIDGGGLVGSPIDVGSRVVGPELRARRRHGLAVVVLSHPHPDHFSGLVTGLEAVQVGALWDTGQGDREGMGGGYATLLASMRARGVSVAGPELLCGEHQIGGARIQVLAPCPSFSSDRGPNDNSFVLRVSFGARSILFVGDAEGDEERTLVATAADALRADVLKVGHHGSRTSSSPAFLQAVGATEAIVSVGRRNRFGHPSEVTLGALAAHGARIWRTDRDGAVMVTTDGSSLEIHAAGSQR